jgi:hypothetical protein
VRLGIVLVGAALALGCGEPTGAGLDIAVEILNPLAGAPAYDTDTLLLLGTATSPAIGVLPDDSAWWTDNGDLVGKGPRSAVLPDQGAHRFVLRVRYGAAEDSAVRTVTVRDGLGRVLWTVPLEPEAFGDGDGLAMLSDGRIVARHGATDIVVIDPDGSVIDQYMGSFALAQASATALPDGTVLTGAWTGFPGGPGSIGGIVQFTPGAAVTWTFSLGAQGTGFHHIHGGVAVDPGGTAYFISGEHEAPVWAVEIGGELRWRTEVEPTDTVGGQENLGFAVLVGDSLVVVPVPTGLAAVGKVDGAVRWVRSGIASAWGRRMPGVGACGTVYVGGTNVGLAAVAPNGVVEWSVPLPGAPDPVVGLTRVYTAYADGSVLAVSLDGTTVDTLGHPPTDDVGAGVTLGAGDILYVAGRDSLFSLNAAGERRFAIPIQGVADDFPFAQPGPLISADGTIYVRDDTGVMAVRDTVGPSTNAPWPTAQGNFQRTGRVAVSTCTSSH